MVVDGVIVQIVRWQVEVGCMGSNANTRPCPSVVIFLCRAGLTLTVGVIRGPLRCVLVLFLRHRVRSATGDACPRSVLPIPMGDGGVVVPGEREVVQIVDMPFPIGARSISATARPGAAVDPFLGDVGIEVGVAATLCHFRVEIVGVRSSAANPRPGLVVERAISRARNV